MMLRLSSEQDAAHKGSTTGGVPAGGTSQSHLQCLWKPCHSASRSSGNEPRDATVKADQQSFFVSEACVSRATDRLSPRSEWLVLVSFIRYHHPLHIHRTYNSYILPKKTVRGFLFMGNGLDRLPNYHASKTVSY